jgi:hypothetical protein
MRGKAVLTLIVVVEEKVFAQAAVLCGCSRGAAAFAFRPDLARDIQ